MKPKVYLRLWNLKFIRDYETLSIFEIMKPKVYSRLWNLKYIRDYETLSIFDILKPKVYLTTIGTEIS